MRGETTTPLVSIGMPVYNGAEFLSEALDSVLNQSMGDLEVIISDNASTDRTQEICEAYAEKDSRIQYIRHPKNIGAAKNYNYTFYVSSGKYFNWLAHDDLLGPEFLSTCLDGFAARGDKPVLVYPEFRYVNEEMEELGGDRPFVNATHSSRVQRLRSALDGLGLVTSIFGLFRRDALTQTRLIGSFVSSDFVLLVECAILGQIVRLNSDPQFFRRIHDSTSRAANSTPEDIANWFDPDSQPVARESRKLSQEYMKSIMNLEALTASDRIALASYLQLRRVRGRSRAEIRRFAKRFTSGGK